MCCGNACAAAQHSAPPPRAADTLTSGHRKHDQTWYNGPTLLLRGLTCAEAWWSVTSAWLLRLPSTGLLVCLMKENAFAHAAELFPLPPLPPSPESPPASREAEMAGGSEGGETAEAEADATGALWAEEEALAARMCGCDDRVVSLSDAPCGLARCQRRRSRTWPCQGKLLPPRGRSRGPARRGLLAGSLRWWHQRGHRASAAAP